MSIYPHLCRVVFYYSRKPKAVAAYYPPICPGAVRTGKLESYESVLPQPREIMYLDHSPA